MTPLRLAHRGDWRAAPENTLAAMRAALAIPGCDGLEFDVRTSRDGVPVLLHDASLDRVQGVAAAVDELDAAALAAYQVPTFEDALSASGHGSFLDIELKTIPGPGFIDILEAARGGAAGAPLRAVAISSFDAAVQDWVRLRRPAWTRWLNSADLSRETVARASELGCAAVAAAWRSIDRAGMERAATSGLGVAAWTVRRRPSYARLARLGVIAICVEAAALDG